MSENWEAVREDIREGIRDISENVAELVTITRVGGDGTPSNPGLKTPKTIPLAAKEVEFTSRERLGGTHQSGDLKLSTEGPGIMPDKHNDHIFWSGEKYQIVDVAVKRPDGQTPISAIFHLRK